VTAVNGTIMSVLLGKTSDKAMGDQVLLTNKTKTGEEETRAFLNFSSSGDDIDGRTSVNSVEQGEYVTETDFVHTYCNNRREYQSCEGSEFSPIFKRDI
jgi:hypothetical protein